MSTVGIVCEYNPFHKGHEYQIQQGEASNWMPNMSYAL